MPVCGEEDTDMAEHGQILKKTAVPIPIET
jgi:hypothetical protein